MLPIGFYILYAWIVYGGIKAPGAMATIIIVPPNKTIYNKSLNQTDISGDQDVGAGSSAG